VVTGQSQSNTGLDRPGSAAYLISLWG